MGWVRREPPACSHLLWSPAACFPLLLAGSRSATGGDTSHQSLRAHWEDDTWALMGWQQWDLLSSPLWAHLHCALKPPCPTILAGGWCLSFPSKKQILTLAVPTLPLPCRQDLASRGKGFTCQQAGFTFSPLYSFHSFSSQRSELQMLLCLRFGGGQKRKEKG